MNRRFFFCLLSALLLAGQTLAASPIPGSTPEKFLGGPENLQLVNTATSIQVYRIVNSALRPKPGKVVTLDGQRCYGAPVNATDPEIQKVISSLSDMTNFGEELACDFDPGIILHFASDAHTLDILVCFYCHEMALYRDGIQVRRPFQWAGGLNSFRKDARHAFVAIAREAFPQDEEIQQLK